MEERRAAKSNVATARRATMHRFPIALHPIRPKNLRLE